MEHRTAPKTRRLAILTAAGLLALTAIGFTVHAGGKMLHHGHVQQSGPLASVMYSPATIDQHLAALPAHLEQVLQLSSQQKDQIKPLVEQARADIKQMQAAYQQQHVHMLQLYTGASVDQQAIEQLRQQQLQQGDIASRRLAQLMVALSNTLTAEQRQSLNARIAQHQG